MSEAVNIDLSGEISPTIEKTGLQKILQHIRNGAGPALLLGALSTRRPWTQFIATENFKPPASIPRLSRRFYRNVEYFQANYLMVFLGLFAYCLITTPLLLIAMVASFFGYRKLTSGPNTWKAKVSTTFVFLLMMRTCNVVIADNKHRDPCSAGTFGYAIVCILNISRQIDLQYRRIIGSWELSKTQQYAVAAGGSMALCWLAGAGAVLFWVLGATVTVVALHASFFDAETLPVTDDQFPLVEEV